MKKNENKSPHHHHKHHHNNDENNLSQNRSLTKSRVSFSEDIDLPTPNNLKSNSQISGFNDELNDSLEQHTQETLLKLRSIIEQKSKLIDIQKERIAYFNKKINEDQIILSKLDQSYQEHKNYLIELQHENQTLVQNFDELKSNLANKKIESQELNEKIKQINFDTEKFNNEIVLYQQKIAQYQEEESINNSRIELALLSQKKMIEDNEELKKQIIEFDEYKSQYQELESKVPDIQERVIQLQKEVIAQNTIVINNNVQLEQLSKENYLLKSQNQAENKALQLNKAKLSELKKELDLKLQLRSRLDVLEENLSKNKQFISEAEQYIQNQDKYLNSIKKINKQKLHENLTIKNHLLLLQDEMKNVKGQLIQITMENANNKQKINEKIEEYVNYEIEKLTSEIKKLQKKEETMKSEVRDMKNIVKKLEIDVNNILSMQNKINEDNANNAQENIPTFEFSDMNFSNLQNSIKNLEENNDVISFLIEDNQNQKENKLKALNDDVPSLPKQTVEEKAAKYGLF